jgi:hypothetical protein
MEFEHVKVLPFVGEKYKTEMPWGVPIMILGESHYSGEPLHADFTRKVVRICLKAPANGG